MNLPKLTVPTFFLTIPSTKKKVKFRPFLSREEKILMLVKLSEDNDEILQAMKDIVDVCTFNKLDVNKLALFDIEHIFLQLRSKSVGEIIEIDMKCNNMIDIPVPEDNPDDVDPDDVDPDVVDPNVIDPNVIDPKQRACGGLIPFAINIKDIKVNKPKDHTNVIQLQDDIGLTLRYPSIEDLKMIDENKSDDVEIIKNLIENIFDKDNVYDIKDTSEEDLQEFMEMISSKQLEDIRKKFFYNMPILEYTVKYKCPECGFKGEYTFKGINDFFE